jgi:hypothetical protein
MKTNRLFAFAIAGAALALAGCSMTPSQSTKSLQIGAGEGVGTKLLKSNSVNGVVNAAYLVQYESEIPNVAGLMQGKITPADLHNILSAENTSTLSADKLSAIGILNGASSEWIAVNQGTPDGALADAAAKNVAQGLANAVGLVTGTNYVPPAPTTMFRTPVLETEPLMALSAPNGPMPYEVLTR